MCWVRNLLPTDVVLLLMIGRLSSASTYLHLGCFTDAASSPDLSGPQSKISDNLTMTASADNCVEGCRTSGYAYCGLQGEMDRCFCGISYGSYGSSNECDQRCDQLYCGGSSMNDVYYTLDVSESVDIRRSLVFVSTSQTFDRARMDCISRNGDLPSIKDIDDLNQTIAVVRNAATTQTKVWIGMRRTGPSSSEAFDWVDHRSPKYDPQDNGLFPWKPEDVRSDCVLLDVASVVMETVPCNALFSYVCRSLPRQEVVYVPVPVNRGQSAIAFYVVIPLFLICYGGSCLAYCVYKGQRSCCRSKSSHSLMAFPVPKNLEGQRGDKEGRHRLIGSSPENLVSVKTSRATEISTFARGKANSDDGPLPDPSPPPPPGYFDERTKRVGARTSQLNQAPRSGGMPIRDVRLGQGQTSQGLAAAMTTGGAALEDGRINEEVEMEMEERSESRMHLIEIDDEAEKATTESKA